MAIERCRLAMGCPSSVRDTGMGHELPVHVDVLFVDQLSQRGNLSHLLEKVYFILAVAVNGHSSRVISSILKPLKSYTSTHAGRHGNTINQHFDHISSRLLNKIIYITDDSTTRATSAQAHRANIAQSTYHMIDLQERVTGQEKDNR